jgi:3D-(3,5/4)-trihydroxycyclohexane-1,2-dione acylhydrolase (decyclizing)
VIEIAPGPGAIEELGKAIRTAKAKATATVIHINSDPLVYAPDGEGWWDVPVAEVSTLDSTKRARKAYLKQRSRQKPLLG